MSQVQLYMFTKSVQLPPLRHGSLAHSSTSEIEKKVSKLKYAPLDYLEWWGYPDGEGVRSERQPKKEVYK